MKKQDEKDLYNTSRYIVGAELSPQVRFVGERLGIPPKRVLYLCEKWARKGWYDYGVSADLGWFLPTSPDTI